MRGPAVFRHAGQDRQLGAAEAARGGRLRLRRLHRVSARPGRTRSVLHCGGRRHTSAYPHDAAPRTPTYGGPGRPPPPPPPPPNTPPRPPAPAPPPPAPPPPPPPTGTATTH